MEDGEERRRMEGGEEWIARGQEIEMEKERDREQDSKGVRKGEIVREFEKERAREGEGERERERTKAGALVNLMSTRTERASGVG